MTKTDRRALLGAMTTAPLLLAAPAAASNIRPSLPRLDGLDAESVLAFGALLTNEPAFASVCARTLAASRRYVAASDMLEEAEAAASEAIPEFPAALIYRERPQVAGADPAFGTRRYTPQDSPLVLDWLARRRIREGALGESMQAAREALRAELASWMAAMHEARERYLVDELHAEACACARAVCALRDELLALPVSSPEALLVKLHTRHHEFSYADAAVEPAAMPGLIADVMRVLAA